MQVLVTVAPTSRSAGDADPGGVTEHALGGEASRPSLSLWDAHALEAAVRLREGRGDVEVVTVTVGPPAADPVARAALAKGADRAVRVWDDRLDEGDLLDPQLTARLLAALAADEEPLIVLAGAQSAADGFGATGVALAARLAYGWATVVTDISLDREAGVVSVRRDLAGNRSELVDVELPAVLTVGTGCNEPRHAGLGAVRAAQRADIAVRSLADLGLTATDIRSRLTQVATGERDRNVTLFEGPPDEAAADLARVLRAHGVDP